MLIPCSKTPSGGGGGGGSSSSSSSGSGSVSSRKISRVIHHIQLLSTKLGSRGGARPPLFLDQTEARRTKNNFWRPLPPPPPALSEGLDSPLKLADKHALSKMNLTSREVSMF